MSHCIECGTTLARETVVAVRSFAEVVRWSPTSPFGLAVASCLGAFLISTAIYFTVGRLTLDVYGMFRREDIDSLTHTSVFMFLPFVSPLLGIAALSFIWWASYRRSHVRLHAFSAALATSVVTALLLFGPRFMPELFSLARFLPVILIGIGTGASVGYYFGAALQVVVGAWLLGWFSRRKSENEVGVG